MPKHPHDKRGGRHEAPDAGDEDIFLDETLMREAEAALAAEADAALDADGAGALEPWFPEADDASVEDAPFEDVPFAPAASGFEALDAIEGGFSGDAVVEPLNISSSTAGTLRELLPKVFGEGGVLAKAIPGYKPRASQLEFALAVVDTMESAGTLVAEAGTGTGKTFSYLIPALLAGSKVIVSTAGKALQEQLFKKDLPFLKKVLGLNGLNVVMLKGRTNYVCPYKLELAMTDAGATLSRGQASFALEDGTGRGAGKKGAPDYLRMIDRLRIIEDFAANTETGDRAEVSGLPEDDPIWMKVTCPADQCLGKECAYWEEGCFVKKARTAAAQADVVVVNHHLYLSSASVRRMANGSIEGLLPRASITIFDEAHNVADIATNFFGETFSTSDLIRLLDELTTLATTKVSPYADWGRLRNDIIGAVRTIRLRFDTVGMMEGESRDINKIQNLTPIKHAFTDLVEAMKAMHSALVGVQGAHIELDQLAAAFAARLDEAYSWQKGVFSKVPEEGLTEEIHEPNKVRWIHLLREHVVFQTTPLSVSGIMKELRDAEAGSWVFTSATMSTGKGDFTHFNRSLGLDETTERLERRWPSPFNYFHQGCLYLPGIPSPKGLETQEHTANVIEAAWPLIQASGGRAFILCTSLHAVSVAADILEEKLAATDGKIRLLVQNDAPKTALLAEFKAHGNAVLVGSKSFWEGVDVQGEALSLVVIDRLPFTSPADPVFAARCADLESRNLSPFQYLSLPEATITLKQGVGRLIRSENDRGVLMIGDTRLWSTGWGKSLVANAIPDFYRTTNLTQAVNFFLNPESYYDVIYE